MYTMIKCIAAVFYLSAGCSFGAMAQDNTLTSAQKKAGWKLLFDGKSTAGWHTYKQGPDDSWEITNGELHCKQEGVQHRADLIEQSDRRIKARIVGEVNALRVVRGIARRHRGHAEDERSAIPRPVDEPPPIVRVVSVGPVALAVLDVLADVPVG